MSLCVFVIPVALLFFCGTGVNSVSGSGHFVENAGFEEPLSPAAVHRNLRTGAPSWLNGLSNIFDEAEKDGNKFMEQLRSFSINGDRKTSLEFPQWKVDDSWKLLKGNGFIGRAGVVEASGLKSMLKKAGFRDLKSWYSWGGASIPGFAGESDLWTSLLEAIHHSLLGAVGRTLHRLLPGVSESIECKAKRVTHNGMVACLVNSGIETVSELPDVRLRTNFLRRFMNADESIKLVDLFDRKKSDDLLEAFKGGKLGISELMKKLFPGVELRSIGSITLRRTTTSSALSTRGEKPKGGVNFFDIFEGKNGKVNLFELLDGKSLQDVLKVKVGVLDAMGERIRNELLSFQHGKVTISELFGGKPLELYEDVREVLEKTLQIDVGKSSKHQVSEWVPAFFKR